MGPRGYKDSGPLPPSTFAPAKSMDIRFCDLCQESVPEADFRSGRASAIKGRVICSQCEKAMGGGAETGPGSGGDASSRPAGDDVANSMRPAPRQAEPRSSGGPPAAAQGAAGSAGSAGAVAARGGFLLALGAAAAIGFGAPILLDRIESLEARLNAAAIQIEAGRQQSRDERAADVQPLRLGLEALNARTDQSLAEQRAELVAEIGALEAALQATEARSLDRGDRLRATMDASSARLDELREGLARATKRQGEVDELKRVAAFHGDLLVELQERQRTATVVVEGGGTRPAAGSAPADLVGSNGGPMASWSQHLGDLESPDAGLRLDAVFALGQTQDPAVASHVIPMLTDEDVFVRMVSAQVLGALRAKSAVPALIDALEDERSAVREAAVVSLRSTTGQQFGFDPAGKVQARGRAVGAWRSWWERDRDEFTGS